MRSVIEPRVRHVVAEHLAVDRGALRDAVSIRDDLAADSLDLVELALLLEHEFGMTLSDRVVAGMRSYGDIVDGIVHLIAARAAASGPRSNPQPEMER
jgi:acyl carrier protein